MAKFTMDTTAITKAAEELSSISKDYYSLADEMYKKLVSPDLTVHTAFYPQCNEYLLDEHVEKRMDLVKKISGLGRGIREKEGIKVRQPLQEVLWQK